MGSSIPISFSCADCNSRVMTVEDFESSCYIRPKDLQYGENRTDVNDELTIFGSPIMSRANRFYKNTDDLVADSKHTSSLSPARRLVSCSNELGNAKFVNSHKNTEELANFELSSPNIIHTNRRQRTFSSNFSSISVNLVESIRKNSIGSYNKTDHSPCNDLI